MGCNCGCGPYQPDGNGNTVAGQLVPPGGTDGQLLAKASDGAFDVEWVDPPTVPEVPSTEGLLTEAAFNTWVASTHDPVSAKADANESGVAGLEGQVQSLEIDPALPLVDNYVLKYDTTLSKWTAGPPVEVPPGNGSGDMMQSVYDIDNNGIVDNSERLGGQLPSDFADATHDHDGTYSPVDHVHTDYEDGLNTLDQTVIGLQDQIDDHESRIATLESGPPSSGGTNLHFATYILAKPTTPEWGDPISVYEEGVSVVLFDSKALLNPIVPSGSAYPGNVGYMHEYWGNRFRFFDSNNQLQFHDEINVLGTPTTVAYAVPVGGGTWSGPGQSGNSYIRTSTPIVPVPESPAELVYLEDVSVVQIQDAASSGVGVPYFDISTLNVVYGTPSNPDNYSVAYAWPVVGTVSGWFPARNFKESLDYSGGGISTP